MFILTVVGCVLMAAVHQPPVCSDPVTPINTPEFALRAECARYAHARYGTQGDASVMFSRSGEVVYRVSCAART